MSNVISGVVTGGVIVPATPLPEGARVEIRLPPEAGPLAAQYTASQLRRMPRASRQAILGAAAALAEQDYRNDKHLTSFDAFSEELDDDST
jgi:hypothetical protein